MSVTSREAMPRTISRGTRRRGPGGRLKGIAAGTGRPVIAAEPSAGLPDRVEQRLADIDLYDRVTGCQQLLRTVESHLDWPAADPSDGGKLLYLLHAALEYGEDAEPDRAKVDAVFDHLGAMAAENSRRLLGGWTRDAFRPVDARKKLDAWLDVRPLPTLAIEVADGGAGFYSTTDEVPFLNERRPVIQLHIAAGAGKREVLDCLDELRHRVTAQWADLVAGKLRFDLLTDAERERGEAVDRS